MSVASKRDRKRSKGEEETATTPRQNVEGDALDARPDDAPVDAAWCERVRESYDFVRDKHEEMVRTKGKAVWKRSMTSKAGAKAIPKTTGNVKPVKLTIEREPESATLKKPMFIVRNLNNSSSQRVPVSLLPDVKCIPAMQFWAQIDRNIAAEDERTLSHIPFMGDDVDPSENFGAELMATFEEGIHGTQPGYEDYMNDRLLFELIRRLQTQFADTFEMNAVSKAIAKEFPNKLSAKQLRNIWPDLLERYAGVRDTSAVLPNVDGPDAVVTSAERTLHSFASLFCRRCYVYDCLLHGVSDPPPPRKRRKNDHSDKPPCGNDCYRIDLLPVLDRVNHQSSLPATKPVREWKSSGDEGKPTRRSHASVLTVTIEEDWSPNMATIFNVMRRSFCDDFCLVAKTLSSIFSTTPKTCKQVYTYAKQCEPSSPRQDVPQSPTKKTNKRTAKDQHRTFRAVKWSSGDRGSVQNEHVYQPCNHPGQQCTKEANCSCAAVDNLCTKLCRCGDNCRIRFPGCRCASGGCRTKQCQCYFANWECDPDICKSCGSDNLDPDVCCRNVNIQRGLQKSLLVAPSDVAGWGCFTQHAIERNEFISEYCGEVISQDESERRGKIYDKQKCSYLFGLNKEFVVDATRKGNVIRFANHSKKPNCRAKVLMVNGDHRIGIFADRPIAVGEELFFDYSYNKAQQIEFVSKERKKIITSENHQITPA